MRGSAVDAEVNGVGRGRMAGDDLAFINNTGMSFLSLFYRSALP
jgi:hypothetical protein